MTHTMYAYFSIMFIAFVLRNPNVSMPQVPDRWLGIGTAVLFGFAFFSLRRYIIDKEEMHELDSKFHKYGHAFYDGP